MKPKKAEALVRKLDRVEAILNDVKVALEEAANSGQPTDD